MSFLSDTTIKCAAVTCSILNCPITARDIDIELNMLGLSQFIVKGKATRSQPVATNADLRRVDIP